MAFDPHYASVSLLLHCDGADGSTAFTDRSPTPKAITVNGNAKISTAQSKFGGSSGDFDGLGDYLVSSSDLGSLGSSDWAIEFWVYYRNLANFPHIVNIGTSTTNRLTIYAEAGVMRVFTGSGGSPGIRITSSATDSTLQWIHYALARSGATMTLYRNGIAVGTSTTTALPTGASQLAIGWQHFGGTTNDYLNGYIDDLRITEGIARYAADFAPPTGPFPDSATPPIVSAYAACTTPLGLPQALAEFAGAARVRASSPGPLAAPSVVVSSAESFEAAVFESIASTAFGTPALTASCKALSVGTTTSFGTPIATTFTPPKIHRTTDAASVYTTKFGTPSVALGAWVVEAGSTVPGTTFGAPVAGTAQAAQPIAPSAAFGLPTSGIALQADGFCATVFGTPMSGRALRADSIAPAGRWGPVVVTTYYEHIAASIPGGPQFGVPSTHWRFLAQAMAPTTRFGKPLLQRGVMC